MNVFIALKGTHFLSLFIRLRVTGGPVTCYYLPLYFYINTCFLKTNLGKQFIYARGRQLQ